MPTTSPSSLSVPLDTTRRRQENEIFKEYHQQVVDYYSSHLRNYPLSKELALATMAKVMVKLADYDPALPMQNWIMRISRNHLIDYYRQRASAKHQLVQVMGGLTGSQDGEETYVLDGEELGDQEYRLLEEEVLAQLEAIPGKEGELLRRHLFSGESTRELAQLYGYTDKEIKKLVEKTKQQLRQQLLGVENEELAYV